MHRPRYYLRSLVAPALILGFLVAGCGGPAEKPILDKYFQASRLDDRMTLNNIATVSFNPNVEGRVQRFDIVSVSPEQRKPLRARELAEEERAAKEGEAAFTKRMKEYQDANLKAIETVLDHERKGTRPRGKELEVQTIWTKFREDTAVHQKRVSDARRRLNTERSLAEVSASDSENPIDATQWDGEVVSKDVTIDAKVRTPDGAVIDRKLVVTIERAELKKDGTQRNGRWIISDIRDANTTS
jgi:hypothetical protein